MNLEARKISFVQEFLKLQNEDVVNSLEKLLQQHKDELIEKSIQTSSPSSNLYELRQNAS